MSLDSKEPVSILLSGPPASAKTMFLEALMKLNCSYFIDGGNTTKTGMIDYIFDNKPNLLIDEIDKMSTIDQSFLLNLMELSREPERCVYRGTICKIQVQKLGIMKPGKNISFRKPNRIVTILCIATAVTITLFEVTPLSNPSVVESIMEPQEQKTVFSSTILPQEEVMLTKTDDEHIIGNTYGIFTSLLLQDQDWSLPAVNNKDSVQEDQEQQQHSTDKLRSKAKILIVDDEPSVTLTFKTVLQGNGFKDNVDVYNDPLEALSNFKPGFYDMLLLDVKMPKMNGFELYEKMREIDDTVKVCFITSYDVYYMSLRELFPTVEVDSFIQKPIGAYNLVKRINQELQSI